MTDPEKEKLLHDLWPENEASMRENALRSMIDAGRRRRAARRGGQAALAIAALVAGGLWLWPGQPAPPSLVSAPEPRKLPAIRHLTEAELKERLSGYAVAYVGSPGEQRVVLLEETPP